VDKAFPGPALQPAEVRERARMAQVIALADHHLHGPPAMRLLWRAMYGAEAANSGPLAEAAAAEDRPAVEHALDLVEGLGSATARLRAARSNTSTRPSGARWSRRRAWGSELASAAVRHDLHALAAESVQRATHPLEADGLARQSLPQSVWTNAIRPPARSYSTKVTAPLLAISNRLMAGLSSTSCMDAHSPDPNPMRR